MRGADMVHTRAPPSYPDSRILLPVWLPAALFVFLAAAARTGIVAPDFCGALRRHWRAFIAPVIGQSLFLRLLLYLSLILNTNLNLQQS